MTVATHLSARGLAAGEPAAIVVVPGVGVALAWAGGGLEVAAREPADVVAQLLPADARWTWWSAREAAAPLVAAGAAVRACWDLAAVGRLAHGLRRDDPAALWAAAHGLAAPPAESRGGPDLFDLAGEDGAAVRADGQLSREWLGGGWCASLGAARRWAELALEVQHRQQALLAALPDPRPAPGRTQLAVLTAYAESAAALLAVELEQRGLPLDRAVLSDLLRESIGPRPADEEADAATRAARDTEVLRHFPGAAADLRNPAQVRDLLARIGVVVPDTRSWRLEPHASTSAAVAALLAWRKAERIATTYGWRWLDQHVGADGRLRGRWNASDGGAGRMTAGAGLHNLPAELRTAVRALPGRVLVRADLGQIEPRVLAAVSRDEALAAAARENDLYAPVAAQLRCDRPTAKVAVLAAMYGQTSGAAGAALRDMDRTYTRAMAYLRDAEEAGRTGRDIRTYGGRLLRLGREGADAGDVEDGGGEHAQVTAGHGRFARNAVIQGAAAELFKAWAATVRSGLGVLDGEIVMCLHDELVVHVPAEHTDAAAQLLLDALAATTGWWAAGSPVRFVAEVASGESWAAAH